jgi:lipoate-protein ligase A
MAGDVALLEAFQQGEIPPTLRVYQWASPALTYGVNQQLPPRLVDACNALGIPMLRRPTGGKAVLHGHDLTVGLVFRAADCLSEPPPLGSPCKQGEPSGGSPREAGGTSRRGAEIILAKPTEIKPADARPFQTPSFRFPLQAGGTDFPHGSPREAGGTLRRGAGFPQSRPYPRQVYQFLAPALIEAFAQVGILAVQGDAPAPDPRSADDGGDCFATPAIADIVHAETGVKLMGCALLVRGACVLMQASIPLRIPEVPVERLFGHPHPAPPPIDPDALTDALYRTLTRVIHTPANAINTAP